MFIDVHWCLYTVLFFLCFSFMIRRSCDPYQESRDPCPFQALAEQRGLPVLGASPDRSLLQSLLRSCLQRPLSSKGMFCSDQYYRHKLVDIWDIYGYIAPMRQLVKTKIDDRIYLILGLVNWICFVETKCGRQQQQWDKRGTNSCPVRASSTKATTSVEEPVAEIAACQVHNFPICQKLSMVGWCDWCLVLPLLPLPLLAVVSSNWPLKFPGVIRLSIHTASQPPSLHVLLFLGSSCDGSLLKDSEVRAVLGVMKVAWHITNP